jgi:hypothetical protein
MQQKTTGVYKILHTLDDAQELVTLAPLQTPSTTNSENNLYDWFSNSDKQQISAHHSWR